MIDIGNYTDETECEYWPCSKTYVRYNSFRDCLNGEDKEYCTASIRNPPSLRCVTLNNHVVFCLSADRVADKAVDYLEASNKPDLYSQASRPFWCRNTSECVSPFNLSDEYRDCPFDDDQIFCGFRRSICEENQLAYRNSVDDALPS